MQYTFTFFGISFIFLMTTLGAAFIYFFKNEISQNMQTAIFGFAGGIMLAASVWSLLLPAIAQAENIWKNYAFIPISIGFLAGGGALIGVEKFLQSSTKKNKTIMSNRAYKLFLSMTLHNIPEGLAVGFAFGAAKAVNTMAAYASALALAIGVGVQNFPEGAAVSLPMKSALNSKRKAFLYGFVSAIVEPIFAVFGYFFASNLQILQPWLLALSAGAMIFVVVAELLPESANNNEKAIGAWGVMLGFLMMMLLDVVFS